MKNTYMAVWKRHVHRALLYFLIALVLAVAPNLAHAASPDEAANTEGFQKGESFSVRKAMFSIYGNVDKQNRSTFISERIALEECGYGEDLISFTAVARKAFVLSNVETVYFVTSGVLLNPKKKGACTKWPAHMGWYVFEKRDDCWKLSWSVNSVSGRGGEYKPGTIDFVKVGKDRVAFAHNAVYYGKEKSAMWTSLEIPVEDNNGAHFWHNVYHDNRGACSMKRGPGKVYADIRDLEDDPDRAALLDTCHRFQTDIYVIPSDSQFYTIRTITTDTLGWKGPDGKPLPPNRLESDFQYSDYYRRYLPVPSVPATGPMVPLFDENSNYQKMRRSLEKSPRRAVRVK